VLERVNAALVETLNDPQVVRAYASAGVESFPKERLSIEAADAFLRDELDFYAKVVRETEFEVER
jgi:hypothetical protein